MKYLWILIFLMIPHRLLAQDFSVFIENSMVTATSTSTGNLDLGVFDAFNPEANCSSFISPNTCTVNGRDNVDINLSFSYLVEIVSGASSVDLDFSIDNGLSGTTGSFTNLVTPGPIYNILNQGDGVFDVSFSVPLFGPSSQLHYGMDIVIDVTINP